mmetsp:Transcript_24536/g.42199  ORF Transcript_24536/g.42199 Transcript_24536/m.42199 type:complete len:248 (+) Transcript_24536:596-1339(+)
MARRLPRQVLGVFPFHLVPDRRPLPPHFDLLPNDGLDLEHVVIRGRFLDLDVLRLGLRLAGRGSRRGRGGGRWGRWAGRVLLGFLFGHLGLPQTFELLEGLLRFGILLLSGPLLEGGRVNLRDVVFGRHNVADFLRRGCPGRPPRSLRHDIAQVNPIHRLPGHCRRSGSSLLIRILDVRVQFFVVAAGDPLPLLFRRFFRRLLRGRRVAAGNVLLLGSFGPLLRVLGLLRILKPVRLLGSVEIRSFA